MTESHTHLTCCIRQCIRHHGYDLPCTSSSRLKHHQQNAWYQSITRSNFKQRSSRCFCSGTLIAPWCQHGRLVEAALRRQFLRRQLLTIAACQVQAMCSGLLQTLSRQTFDDKLQHPFTAHPKVDPMTGDLFVGPLLCLSLSGTDYHGEDQLTSGNNHSCLLLQMLPSAFEASCSGLAAKLHQASAGQAHGKRLGSSA